MGQALYRKYRSKSLSEIVGQEHITKTLQQALKQGRISHAYLLTGPRGVGKTSIARILAHEINNLPYTDDSPHMDIIEIDAASNRRIDEIRELREKVYVAPTSAKYKVYIIDEVHMLTREAFNALLKTLEEPPAHAVFILATTDAHKLPETIVSRTQRFSFQPVQKDQVIAHLKDIAAQEKLQVSPEALELLAEHGEGSFRDSISLLDQASSYDGELDASAVQQLLGIPPAEAINGLLAAVLEPTTASERITRLNALYDQGFQAAAIAKKLGQALRQLVLTGTAQSPPQLFNMLQQLIQVPVAHDPERFLEVVLLQAMPLADSPPQQSASAVEAVSQPSKVAAEPKPEPKLANKPKGKPQPTPDEPSQATAAFDDALWPQVLQALKQKHNTIYSVVRMAQPDFTDEKSLRLTFAFPFHQKRIAEAGNRQLLSGIIHELTGRKVAIDCILDETVTPPKTAVPPITPEPATDLTAISNIFGGGELLES